MLLLGVCGFKRAGKSSVASILHKHYAFQPYGFADALRGMARAIDPLISTEGAPAGVVGGCPPHTCRYSRLLDSLGYEAAKEIPDFRRFLQRLGTEGVRGTFGPTAWVDALAYRLQQEAPAKVCINDVRFHSEAEWICSQGGTLWRVSRPGVGGEDPHPSEADIPHLPATRDICAGTLDELEAKVRAAFEIDFPPQHSPSL